MNAHVGLHLHEPLRMRIEIMLAQDFRCWRDSDPGRYRNCDCVEGVTSLRAGEIPVRAGSNAGSGCRIRIRLFSRFAGGARGRQCGSEEFAIAAGGRTSRA